MFFDRNKKCWVVLMLFGVKYMFCLILVIYGIVEMVIFIVDGYN